MYDIYYAHHQWKYGTKVEQYELDLIKRYFPSASVFNPSTDLKTSESDGEENIMLECFEVIRNSDMLVFSSMDGVVGTGVYHEVRYAQKLGKIVFYIFDNTLYSDFSITKFRKVDRTDRLYGRVCINL